jgi:sulfatase modifying factor 1
MDPLIDELSKLSPFGPFFRWLGFDGQTSNVLSTALFLAICCLMIYAIKKTFQHYRLTHIARKRLSHHFDYKKVIKEKKYFIDTQYQKSSPGQQDEPNIPEERYKLIPHFLKKVFKDDGKDGKFYIILGDSGMGKSTFITYLYLQFHSLLRRRSYKMKLFKLTNNDCLDIVKQIPFEEARNTILLLDALDEDPHMIAKKGQSIEKAFNKRVDVIIQNIRNFKKVIITCRTQYFPNQEERPYEIKVKRNDEQGYYTLNKLYISPFTDKEATAYLRKKYGILPFVNRNKKQKAAKILKRSSKLMTRPMLLSYIDFLCEENRAFETQHDIYETLIQKWLEREAAKRKLFDERETFIKNLKEVSLKIAEGMYHHWKNSGTLSLTDDEVIALAEKNHIDLKREEITGQSLLTADGHGIWKFSHKSIFEFLLSVLLCDDWMFLRKFDGQGMNMTIRFLYESRMGFFLHKPVSHEPNMMFKKDLHFFKPFALELDPRFKSIDHHKDASAVEKVVSDFCNHLTDLFSSYPLNAEGTDFPVFPFHKFAIAGNRLPKEFSLQHFRPSYRSKEIIDTQRDEYKTYYILDFPEFYLQVHDATSGAWNGSFRMRNVPSERFYPDKPTLFILRWSFSNSPFEDRKD